MPEPSPALEAEERPILGLLQQIKEGTVAARTLTKEVRQGCVEALLLEGYALAGIAQILDRNEKTIRRDLGEIRARHALTPSPELARQLIGGLLMKSEAHQARLMRLARATEGSVGDRAQAEALAWQVARDTVRLLQSLGYLPQRPQQVMGDVTHRLDAEAGEASLAETEATLQEIERVARETQQLTPALRTQLQALRDQLAAARLSHTAQQLLGRCQPPTLQETLDADPPR